MDFTFNLNIKLFNLYKSLLGLYSADLISRFSISSTLKYLILTKTSTLPNMTFNAISKFLSKSECIL